mmetsp:Transcript_26060/g.48606  ORF Transcript_26060/g.48606 Transcript_26060/m.48606 type:complete len:217 (+) Transcript_26060:1629-2279(+)
MSALTSPSSWKKIWSKNIENKSKRSSISHLPMIVVTKSRIVVSSNDASYSDAKVSKYTLPLILASEISSIVKRISFRISSNVFSMRLKSSSSRRIPVQFVDAEVEMPIRDPLSSIFVLSDPEYVLFQPVPKENLSSDTLSNRASPFMSTKFSSPSLSLHINSSKNNLKSLPEILDSASYENSESYSTRKMVEAKKPDVLSVTAPFHSLLSNAVPHE